MEFTITPAELLTTIKRLFPHKSRLIKKGPLFTIAAEGDYLDVMGQFDNKWSVPASVRERGECTLDLVAFTKVLGGYPPKVPLTFTLHDDGLRFGTTKVAVHKGESD